MRDHPADSPITRPPGPGGFLGIRNLLTFYRDPLAYLLDMSQRFGDLARSRILGAEFYYISHPDDIEAVLVQNHKDMIKDTYTRHLSRALGQGLVSSDGELWRRHRKLVSFAFTPRRIQTYGEAMVAIAGRGVDRWSDDDVIDLHAEMSRITMDVVGGVLFGANVDDDAATVGHAMEAVNEFFAGSLEHSLDLPAWVPTPRNRRFNAAVRTIDDVLYRIIAGQRNRQAEHSAENRDDLLSALLAAHRHDAGHDAGQPDEQSEQHAALDDQELRDECITLFLAGHETTALALVHALYLLSKHPEIEARFHAELTEVLGDRPATAADVKALEYTGRIIKETMRLYPPVWVVGRQVVNEIELGGHRVPRGAQILASQWVVHRDPRWYDDPEAFDPDRWLPERAGKLPRMAYFPFGAGPRICIGNHFATMEAVLLLATMGQRFHLELLPGQNLEFSPSVTLRPRRHLRMRLRARAASQRTASAA